MDYIKIMTEIVNFLEDKNYNFLVVKEAKLVKELLSEENFSRYNSLYSYIKNYGLNTSFSYNERASFLNNLNEKTSYTCEECVEKKTAKELYDSSEYTICKDCEESLENKTGYCDLSCRMSGECSGAC